MATTETYGSLRIHSNAAGDFCFISQGTGWGDLT